MYLNKYNQVMLLSSADQERYYGTKRMIKEAGLDDGK